ncbi:hypothetical protein UNSWDHB_133 [Dehalobacter sp. UNSWDHB]|jgi:Uncharacterized protein containing LysM domain|uniref:LysM peptidoglycan-binding domain-containing protein n=1 Tax=unclassified Dehalobacter TaxID=2635733 RepID=UPI00028A926A|nr:MULTISPECIES: LysM peptidoglycan-binding domain-containing protein [unclassified Dehalobacter]AFV03507.1 hypothetical protein DHBDCA_p2480 [Dehalobacter sp. DCA]AFV06492.1 hypothetical protein DCF50_p2489 [Dehalobacter sp. CF]EQB22530.1 hypothetical protein UNSWDHB_133 [Dehalobacter sp. UNSWDHB]
MKIRKKTALILTVLFVFIVVLAGCTQNQLAIFNAYMKMQDVASMQQHMTMSLQMSGTGFDQADQEQIDSVAEMLNNAKLDVVLKMNCNEEKTIAKLQADCNVIASGLNINMPFWVDEDFSGKTPKLIEVFKIPQIAAAYLPPGYAGKPYMVINPFDAKNTDLKNMDVTNLIKLQSDLQKKSTDFLNSYVQRFNPNIDVVSESANDGLGSQKYTIKLNDAQLKEFIRYAMNNFAKDKEASNFLNDYFTIIAQYSELSDSSSEFGSIDEESLTEFNSVMDQLNDVPILGDKGIELTYTISSEGYITHENGSINLKLDMAALNKLMNDTVGGEEIQSDVTGILNLTFNYDTDITNINVPVDIQMPELNSSNSFSYLDLIPKTDVEVVNSTYKVLPGDTLATIALNHYGSYKYSGKIYEANRDMIEKNNNRLYAGMVLTLPPEGLLPDIVAGEKQRIYTVKAGDTLAKIAQLEYGDASLYMKIYAANKNILSSPDLIYEGQKILIP